MRNGDQFTYFAIIDKKELENNFEIEYLDKNKEVISKSFDLKEYSMEVTDDSLLKLAINEIILTL